MPASAAAMERGLRPASPDLPHAQHVLSRSCQQRSQSTRDHEQADLARTQEMFVLIRSLS
jgi:hypothetical protein